MSSNSETSSAKNTEKKKTSMENISLLFNIILRKKNERTFSKLPLNNMFPGLGGIAQVVQ
jgi:hypothetical protein